MEKLIAASEKQAEYGAECQDRVLSALWKRAWEDNNRDRAIADSMKAKAETLFSDPRFLIVYPESNTAKFWIDQAKMPAMFVSRILSLIAQQ